MIRIFCIVWKIQRTEAILYAIINIKVSRKYRNGIGILLPCTSIVSSFYNEIFIPVKCSISVISSGLVWRCCGGVNSLCNKDFCTSISIVYSKLQVFVSCRKGCSISWIVWTTSIYKLCRTSSTYSKGKRIFITVIICDTYRCCIHF